MSRIRELTKGLLRENPTLVLVIGLCPTLAITTNLWNAVGMGLSATFVLVMSNVIISAFRRFFPRSIRMPCFIVVIATFTTIVQMVLAGFFPALNEALGIFIPLIVVNCIIMARAEAFASKRGVLDSALDGIGMGLGFTMAIIVISAIREVLGSWSLFGVPITDGGFAPAQIVVQAPGAFVVLGCVIAASAFVQAARKESRRAALASEEYRARESARPRPERRPAAEGASQPGGA